MTGSQFYPCFRCGREAVLVKQINPTFWQRLFGRKIQWRFVCPQHPRG